MVWLHERTRGAKLGMGNMRRHMPQSCQPLRPLESQRAQRRPEIVMELQGGFAGACSGRRGALGLFGAAHTYLSEEACELLMGTQTNPDQMLFAGGERYLAYLGSSTQTSRYRPTNRYLLGRCSLGSRFPVYPSSQQLQSTSVNDDEMPPVIRLAPQSKAIL